MQFVDHIFVLLLFVVQPTAGAIESRRIHRLADAGQEPDRVRFYQHTMMIEWAFLFVVFAAWYLHGRSLRDLGFIAPAGIEFWIGVAALMAMTIGLLVTGRRVKAMSATEKEKQVAALGKLSRFLPQTKPELKNFYAVSLTAGVVEEIVYRGFVLWYLAQLIPLWAAVLVSSVAFGLGHSYQGPVNALKCGLLGLAFGIFYVFTGSIWLPIIAHALLDALQGSALYDLLRNDSESLSPQTV